MANDPKPETKAKKAEDTLFVTDPSTKQAEYDAEGKIKAGTGYRIHEQIINGEIKSYRFEHTKPLEMPRAEALKFARWPSWIVKDANGNRISAVPQAPALGAKFALGLDQIVATYAELSDTALLNRVQMEAGGERFTAQMPRERLIAFLTSLRKAKEVQNKAASDNAPDEFTPAPGGADEEVMVAA